MKFSKYQEAIFTWFDDHQVEPASLVIEAVAGSGKTTTIVEAANRIPAGHKAVFLAFNKSIATELGERLPKNIESKTLNALGWALLRTRCDLTFKNIDAKKSLQYVDKYLPPQAEQYALPLANVVAKAKAHGYVPEGVGKNRYLQTTSAAIWGELIDRYDVDFGQDVPFGTVVEWADELLTRSINDLRVVDFDDQLYLPIVLNLGAWKYQWIIIDEAQDVSHVQRMLLQKFLHPTQGRLIAVGDSRQAIYGFRGADSESLANIRKVFKASELPLSMTYRCPKAVVEIAKRYVPSIECPEDAPEGRVSHPEAWNVADFGDSDMVVCRNTAPLISLVYRCISRGVPATVMGRDIGRGLINLIKKLAGRGQMADDLPRFEKRLADWSQKEIERALAKGDDTKAQSIDDKRASLEAIVEFSEANSVTDLINSTERLFSDDAHGTVLSTVHKAKGLEADRVFILEPHLMPSPWARQEWQMQQEENIIYVAVTRAHEELVYLPLDNVQ